MAARFTIKAVAVMALVCLVLDWSHAENTEQQQGLNLDAAKDKVNGFMKNIKQSASETFTSVKDSETTKKVESQVSSFFSNAFNKLKNAFGSTKTNQDDLTKQEAIKAFDDYAQKQQKKN